MQIPGENSSLSTIGGMRVLSCFVSRLSPACYQQQLSASYLVISNSLESYLLKKKIEFIFKIILNLWLLPFWECGQVSSNTSTAGMYMSFELS